MILITNNLKVAEDFSKGNEMVYLEKASYLDVLNQARDLIHKNHELLTHPLTGSVKPNETPFKSLAVSEKATSFNMQSLEIIENAIETTEKLLNDCKVREWPERILDDFRLIDYNLIRSGLESINQFK